MIESVDGIVISETNYNETSKIINIITKEHGKIGVLSKGCRTIKSPLRSVSTKLTYATFQIRYKSGSKVSTLTSADVIKEFKNIISDITKISYASYILELTDQVMSQTDNKDIFDLLINAFLKIEEGIDPVIIANIVELKLLDYLGVKPDTSRCVVCGSIHDIVTIDAYKGGYLCKNCYTNERLVSEKTLKLLQMLSLVDLERVTKIKISEPVKKELNSFIDDYYDRYTGLYLKSKQLLKNLRLLG